jgi:hypothetical protein
VDNIVLSCPTLVGATDVALRATGGGTEVDMVLPRAGATIDWTPNVPRRNVPRFRRVYFVLPVNDFARRAMTRESSGSLYRCGCPSA